MMGTAGPAKLPRRPILVRYGPAAVACPDIPWTGERRGRNEVIRLVSTENQQFFTA